MGIFSATERSRREAPSEQKVLKISHLLILHFSSFCTFLYLFCTFFVPFCTFVYLFRPTDAFRSSLRTPIRMPLRKPTTTTTTTTEKPKIRKPGKPAVVIGTSVSSSVSVSSSSGKAKEEDTPQALEKMTFAERFKRHRLRLFQERKRFY